MLSERTPTAPLMASAANAAAGSLTQSRHRPVTASARIRTGQALDYLAVQGYVVARLTHQPEAFACPAGVIYPPETPKPACTWPPAGVRLEGKVSPPAMLPGGRGPRCVAPAQRGPLSRPFWVPPPVPQPRSAWWRQGERPDAASETNRARWPGHAPAWRNAGPVPRAPAALSHLPARPEPYARGSRRPVLRCRR